jgi:poly(A) polymerase
MKLLAAPGAAATLRVMAGARILERILPHTEEWRALRRLPPDPVLRLFALAREPQNLKDKFRLSNHEAKRIAGLGEASGPTPALRPAEQRIVLYHLGAETWRDAAELAWARSKAPLDDRAWKRLLNLPERWPVPVLPVRGKDLVAAGVSPGPALGAALKRIEDRWVASDFRLAKKELIGCLGTLKENP